MPSVMLYVWLHKDLLSKLWSHLFDKLVHCMTLFRNALRHLHTFCYCCCHVFLPRLIGCPHTVTALACLLLLPPVLL